MSATIQYSYGPWEARNRGDIVAVCKGFPQVMVAKVLGQPERSTRDANARLIAAAPELLSALKIARDYVTMKHPGDVQADADLHTIDMIIAKAAGEAA